MSRLLRGALLLLLLWPTTGRAQYFFLDVNGDGHNDRADALNPDVRTIDVWCVTDRNADGTPAVCPTAAGDEQHFFSILSYEFVLKAWGPGAVRFGPWVPSPDMAAFQNDLGSKVKGNECHIAFGGVYTLDPGTYRLGTLAVTVTGSPRLSFVTTGPSRGVWLTSFGSDCPGRDFDDTIKLGSDFVDAAGTAPPPAGSGPSVWGTVQRLYR